MVKNYIVNVNFTGSISLNCLFEGIGVFYTDNVTIDVKLNKLTGGYVSGVMMGID